MSKRASYRAGVEWIARNDNDGAGDNYPTIAGYISTLLLADLFGKEPLDVAEDIVYKRQTLGIKVGGYLV